MKFLPCLLAKPRTYDGKIQKKILVNFSWMNEWWNEWMNYGMNERMNDGMTEGMNDCMNDWMNDGKIDWMILINFSTFFKLFQTF